MADFAFIMLCVVLTKCSRSSLVEMAGVALYIATVSEKSPRYSSKCGSPLFFRQCRQEMKRPPFGQCFRYTIQAFDHQMGYKPTITIIHCETESTKVTFMIQRHVHSFSLIIQTAPLSLQYIHLLQLLLILCCIHVLTAIFVNMFRMIICSE